MRGDKSEAHYVDLLLQTLTYDSVQGKQALQRRNQCMKERELYREQADRYSVYIGEKYYFVDRMWMCSWFLHLCDGKLGEGPVTNDGLEDPDVPGRLNPASRPRGSFKGGFSIVTPTLWEYLVNTYGLIGGIYTSGIIEYLSHFLRHANKLLQDDTTGPDYEPLNNSIVEWRLN